MDKMRCGISRYFNNFENVTQPEVCMTLLMNMMAELRTKLESENRYTSINTDNVKWIMTKDTFSWLVHVCDYKCGFAWSVEYGYNNTNTYSIMDVKIEFIEDELSTKCNIVKLVYEEPDWVVNYVMKDVDATLEYYNGIRELNKAAEILDKAYDSMKYMVRNGNGIEIVKENLMKSFYVGCGKKVTIENVIFNNPATIVFWSDGTKTVVKKQKGDKKFDPEKGLAMAICKKIMGNKGNFNDIFKEWIEED